LSCFLTGIADPDSARTPLRKLPDFDKLNSRDTSVNCQARVYFQSESITTLDPMTMIDCPAGSPADIHCEVRTANDLARRSLAMATLLTDQSAIPHTGRRMTKAAFRKFQRRLFSTYSSQMVH
jgi:hypothetical protein